jgi:hypothetical protein
MIPATGDAFTLLRAALEAAGVRYAIGGSWASAVFGEHFFPGGEASEVQWRDIRAAQFNRVYLEQGAGRLGIGALLKRALEGQ